MGAQRSGYMGFDRGPCSEFGDGSDNDFIFPSGTTVLTRDIYAEKITIPPLAIIDASGGLFRLWARQSITVAGLVMSNGSSATGSTAGAGASGSGGGGAGATGAGSAADSVGLNCGAAATGGSGGAGSSGAGGAGGTGSVNAGVVRDFATAAANFQPCELGIFSPSVGGGGGGGDGSHAGGGGGGGGGLVFIAAPSITILSSAIIEATGGDGAGGSGGNAGGGAGGNGGLVYLIGDLELAGAVNVGGGVAGAAVGTGHAGVVGAAGTVVTLA